MTEKQRDWFIAALLIFLCIVVYGRCVTFEHILYDDPQIIFENENVMAGLTWDSVRWALTTPNFGLYMALPTISLQLDRELFGDWAGGYHGTTLVWHIICVLSFFWIMRRLTGLFTPIVLASFLVAVHPIQSMTINWIGARNEIMPVLFMLWSIHFYRLGCLQADASVRRKRMVFYGISLLFMFLGLLSKQGIVLLPVILLLLDYWPLNRIELRLDAKAETLRRMGILIVEKIPWFLLSYVGIRLAFYGKTDFAYKEEELVFSIVNIGFSLTGYMRYIFHLLYPENYTMAYMVLKWTPAWWMVLGSALTLALIFATVLSQVWRFPWMIICWGWFFCLLLPVSGLVRYADESIALRYLYASGMGFHLFVGFGLYSLIRYMLPVAETKKTHPPSSGKKKGRKKDGKTKRATGDVHPLFWGITIVLVVASSAQAYRQSGFWRTGETLAERALIVTKGKNTIAHNHLSNIRSEQGLHNQALSHAVRTLELEPDRPIWQANYVRTLMNLFRYEESLELAKQLLEKHPASPVAMNLYGGSLTGLMRFEEAIPYLEQALDKEPRYVPALYNLGLCYEYLDRPEEAKAIYERALKVQPGYAAVLVRLEALNKSHPSAS
ncbi:MAG: tetratricopeptide repeat protein [Candidatus Hydrogenedens sp.]|nr:tetratricopeptide repeat protein [Candidatus Hydrogenedens sp.]